ncbi:ketoacyl-synt-domain-containing protein [Zopfia rhizophila CBS 207.26]|uniref:Ketoacyl-synt-domain-containing protein n=1 Tax=Zopfia rhizophila CBS 207.26 TaxID=1314779 RepID=A0A6A6EDT9_9PEZI|nr:ketoacyl-synt-domain-containing protein [Zopfia rhizophila CBS 207.26]
MTEDIPHPIAIIGSACRLPGNATSPSKLWELLRNPRDLLKEVPRDRFYWEGVYRSDGLHGATRTKDAYWLDENIRQFDPTFFNINPAEAETLDPQHRLLLENVYEAIESAGLTLEDLQGSDTGVFVGMMRCDYFDNANRDIEATSGQIMTTGTSRSIASNRISYTFDFRGPSVTLDTACSSSMLAVHLAVASLRQGESKIAFACGTSLNLTPNEFISLTKMNMMSADGRSKMFDEAANGYGKGEGVGVVCLKRLDAAIHDDDHIECVIRETGTNQDGRTKGITMPSAESQADLIRKTYKHAGLDPTQIGSRPSFFEAHGTGTPAGDPLEAQAVEAAFFPPGQEYSDDEILYIGSIKTVIGHTEGTAGIAGLLRAALAVQNSVMPPNLLFQRMSHMVAPFTKHLRVVSAANPWPPLPLGCPRRASINSFGFGGSNVHVIIESFDSAARRRIASMLSSAVDLPIFTPFTFSAVSERALIAIMQNYLQYLKDHKDNLSLRDLAWTLQYKRSQFAFRCTVSAMTHEELQQKLQSAIDAASKNSTSQAVVRSSQVNHPRIMGVFTGQGAQWATMGKDLINRSSYVRRIVDKLDEALSTLPDADRPTWKIEEELMVDGTKSRMNEALLSQPLTTAIQIVLVDLLQVAGVKLHTVVGHSSGEIGAAYAAGLIQAEDAIRIAYYRGLHSQHAAGESGQLGAMLATYMTPEQAANFCSLPEFRDRIIVAACNAPAMVTLSGDADVIGSALASLDQQNIFARKLRVDKAYHSLHMQPCADPYLRSLEECGIEIKKPRDDSPIWFSSVHPGERMVPSRRLRGTYWVENLISAVLFSEAITTVLSEMGVPDLYLEVGPHPSLKEPIRQIVGGSAKNSSLYSGLLMRGADSIISFSEALGAIWSRFGRSTVNFSHYDKTLLNSKKPMMINDLPTYPWQHDREYWWENRYLRRRFQETDPPTELLGVSLSTGAKHEYKWRSFLKPKDVLWMLDHRLNGMAVLPGAAYIVMACSGAERIFHNHSIEMIEVEDLHFFLPITFPDSDSAIETVLTVSSITSNSKQGKAIFVIDFCSDQRSDELMTAARGCLKVHFGIDFDRSYPETLSHPSGLTNVSPELFYRSLSHIGFGYTGPFLSISSMKRRMDFATGEIRIALNEMIFHPAILDALFQATYAAYSFPGDTSMPNFPVPSNVRSIKVFPTRCREITATSQSLQFDIARTKAQEFGGVLYSTSGEGTMLQIEGFCTAPFRLSTPADDLQMFSEVIWRPYLPNAKLLASSFHMSPEKVQFAEVCERAAFFYLRTLNEVISWDEEQRAEEPLRHLLEFARMTVTEVLLGLHPHMKKEWLNDTEEDIAEIMKAYPDSIDLQLLDAVGKAYPFIICRQKTAISTLMENDMLSKIYKNGLGFPEANAWLAQFVQILSHRSPRIRMLEVGAGTGSVTGAILEGSKFASYTFTDISPAFLAPAKEKFRRYEDKMEFRVFNMEKDIFEQGYQAGSFEVVVASNVLHATEDAQPVLARIRQLLRPGGYLVCLELSANYDTRNIVVMGGLTGWWLGHGKGRTWSPAYTEQQWDSLLKQAGFSGVDTITPVVNELLCPYRVFVSQAIDDRIMFLRKPLSKPDHKCHDKLMILGGDSAIHTDLVAGIDSLLSPYFQEVVRVPTLHDVCQIATVPYAVLSLVELDEPVFYNMSATKLAALQKLFSGATDILWLTAGCRSPKTTTAAYANMTLGLGRTVRNEQQHLRLTFLDVSQPDAVTARCLSESMLRWYILGQWKGEGWQDDVLFGHETEMAIENGNLLIPSAVHCRSQNDRYNSQHRRITQDVAPHASTVEIKFKDGHYNLRQVPPTPTLLVGKSTVFVKMLYSTLYAIKCKPLGFLFVGFGLIQGGEHAIVLTETIGSLLEVPRCAVYTRSASNGSEKQYLRAFGAYMVAHRVVGTARHTGHLLVLSSDPIYMSFIEDMAARTDKKVVFITSDPSIQRKNSIFLHPRSLDLTIRQAIPKGTSVFINLSNRPDDEVLFKRVAPLFSVGSTKIKDADTIFMTRSSGYNCAELPSGCEMPSGERSVLVEAALTRYKEIDVYTVSPKEIVQQTLQPLHSILDWTAADRIPVNIRPACSVVGFSPDKTYLIIGSSDIAQSICEWMVEKGARFIMMASRDPSGLASWAGDMASRGAFVDLHAADISKEDTVRSMLAKAKAGQNARNIVLPQIAGVINLALVLKDVSFSKMTFEDLRAVTDVKAKGSLILHEQLLGEKLDFFIMASSISYVIGNPGQSNYTAGNAFMVGLANYRRNIGLPASVIDIGRVTGLGYITRSTRENVRDLSIEEIRLKALYPVSERDLHQIFAEAVLASPHDSGISPEIITGIRSIEPDMIPQSCWALKPMFCHLRSYPTAEMTVKREKKLTVREKLSEELSSVAKRSPDPAKESSEKQIYEIIRSAFLNRLSTLLQIDIEDIDETRGLLNLGVDSLVASEIGSWARKELKVPVPHSMIFGDSSLVDIVNFVVRHLDKGWVVLKGQGGV